MCKPAGQTDGDRRSHEVVIGQHFSAPTAKAALWDCAGRVDFDTISVNVEMEYSSNGSQSNFGWDRALPPSLRNQSRPLSTSLQDGVPDSEDEVQTSGKLLLERNSNLTNEISKLKEHNSDLNNKIVELEESFYREEEENQNLNHELVELKAEKISQANEVGRLRSENSAFRETISQIQESEQCNHAMMRETSLKTWTVRRYYHLQIQTDRAQRNEAYLWDASADDLKLAYVHTCRFEGGDNAHLVNGLLLLSTEELETSQDRFHIYPIRGGNRVAFVVTQCGNLDRNKLVNIRTEHKKTVKKLIQTATNAMADDWETENGQLG
ncbi:hypothetical protein B0H10DRAFT_1962709 [Mycena sp. CBHHK59/15]|nr:hypothetical protein B0H10DRAFT_1962709 [Mycena sp. CBHHK59/15]